MKILINDYGSYAFPYELSVELADLGHQILHTYCDSLEGTPNGRFLSDNCHPHLQIAPLKLQQRYHKQTLIKRRQQDLEYASLAIDLAAGFNPDIILSANTPLDAQCKLLRFARQHQTRFIHWFQDVLSHAIEHGMRAKLGTPGKLLAIPYRKAEQNILRQSDHVVSITPDFDTFITSAGVPLSKRTVIENWAPIDAFPCLPRQNGWASSRGWGEGFNFVYSGTLSLKHNPKLLLTLASQTADIGGRVIVRSIGSGADYLNEWKAKLNVDNLFVEPFGPFSETAHVFSSADALVALLEPAAGNFSVPSKVLSYLCAGRPLLMSVPKDNLAARNVQRINAGLIAEPNDSDTMVRHARQMINDREACRKMGDAARRYAEETFSRRIIAQKFLPPLGIS